MQRVLVLVLAVGLTGCVFNDAVIRSQTVSYDDIVEDTTNKLLLLNILRAKDEAPLHFDEIPSIHASIQASASATASWPFGPSNKGTVRNSIGGTLGYQLNPSFEIDHLDTKDFATGVASPIDPKFVKYWLDRGLDRRIVLLLFFSAADIIETDKANNHTTVLRVRNSPREAIDTLKYQISMGGASVAEDLRCDTQSDFQHYLKLIDSLTDFSAHSFTERRLLAKNLTINWENSQNGLKDFEAITALDPTKYQWVRNTDGSFNIYAVSSDTKTALCFSDEPIAQGGQSIGPSSCVSSVVDIGDGDTAAAGGNQPPIAAPPVSMPDKQPSEYCANYNQFIEYNRVLDSAAAAKPAPSAAQPQWELRLEIRSVGEIIQFLGDLVEYQEELSAILHENAAASVRLNNPLTFGYCVDENSGKGEPGCADVFFNLRHHNCDTRFSVSYRGKLYAVPNYNPPDTPSDAEGCDDGDSSGNGAIKGRDHSLEVLSVVHQLIDLQKSAQDIRETPYVQLLP